MTDIREACDLMLPVWERTAGVDGWVSLEVDPTLAYERERTFEQAIRFNREVGRPNLYVKIPATEPGLGAIEDCIAKGVSINVTLIFSLERYAAVAEAYLRGLERLVAGGGDPGTRALGRELLRLARRQRGRQAPRGRRAQRPAGEARGRERASSPTSTTSTSSATTAGPTSPARARGRSGACGRRPRRRTPPTAT